MKRALLLILVFIAATLLMALPAFATSLPSSAPSIDDLVIYRNVLETGDMFIFIKENTPYTTPPTDYGYSQAFVWQLYDTTDTVEIARTVGYDYNDNGYNQNVIGFYFSATDAPAWGAAYYLKLVGTPLAFATPPSYQFPIEANDYSNLTDQNEVQIAISNKVIDWGEDLNTEWGLASSDYLTTSSQTAQALSLEGESFFRGAVYGIQSLAPFAFQLVTLDVTSVDRTWTDNYTTSLQTMYDGTYLKAAQEAANIGLGSSYNLAGIIGVIFMLGFLIGGCIYLGGDIWGSLLIAAGPLVIGGRLAMLGMGELAFIAALMWLFISGKIWKVF
jgi:hypothetical protein